MSPEVSAVDLHRVFLDSAGAAAFAPLLSSEERRRADAFHFEHDRRRWIASRTALRILLGRTLSVAPDEIALETTPEGKPFLSGHRDIVEFNLSHSGDRALIAISKSGPVGVDIERLERDAALESSKSIFCSTPELKRVSAMPVPADRALELIRIWCAKEAFLKALGSGFSVPPHSLVTFWEADGSGRILADSSLPHRPAFRLHFPGSLFANGFFAAVALPEGLSCPVIREFEFGRP